MRLMTDKVRLRIDLALAGSEESASPGSRARRQLLAPPDSDHGSERTRPTLVPPAREPSTRLELRGPFRA
jgi:hypothetical protein